MLASIVKNFGKILNARKIDHRIMISSRHGVVHKKMNGLEFNTVVTIYLNADEKVPKQYVTNPKLPLRCPVPFGRIYG